LKRQALGLPATTPPDGSGASFSFSEEELDSMSRRRQVLIAEDETIIRLDLRGQLADLGYDVCAEARTGGEAVTLAARHAPDIAILDVKMPGRLDGIDAARQILAERPLPVLLLTAYGQPELVRRAAAAGVFAYLAKPYRAADLAPAIELAVARHAELNELRDHVAGLAEALAARKVIERAKGLLMQREGLTESDAFGRLRAASQRSGQPMRLVAETIVAALS
jgi:two-component system, response regulator PdtaR